MSSKHNRRSGVVGMALIENFSPQTLDKVERLLDLLQEIERHPILAGKLALHGGTAINLFMLGIPRLSVDIDVSYVGAVSREDMLVERPTIEQALQEVARYLGYNVEPGEYGHAGRTFMLRYSGQWGPDHVKIDCIYMNRSPLLPLAMRETPLRPGQAVRTFSDVELAGGKVKALLDRVKVRDLYDISTLGAFFTNGIAAGEVDADVWHKIMLYYASLSAAFPFGFEGRERRFADKEQELREQLYPMLRFKEQPALYVLMQDAANYIEHYVLPRTKQEEEYLQRFAAAEYRPELLFGESSITGAALVHPEALWKLKNLREMP